MKLSELVNQIVDLINSAIPVVVGVALLFYFLAIIRYISKAGDAGGKSEEKKTLLWGLIGLFVIFSIWGILNLFENMLFGCTVSGLHSCT
ncbi:MAG: hypothetical protein KBD50_01190 [Candidatus Pacebacteria bacterium]|nr:hypothetical protein [Candidatus Paceibacterota bacterium]